MSDKGFEGFSVPDGAWMPPELIYMIPSLGMAQLKILIILIYQQLQIAGSTVVSLTDLEHLTGLSRVSVSSTLAELLDQGLIERQKVGKSYSYQATVKLVYQSPVNLVYPKLSKLRESDSIDININSLSDSLNLTAMIGKLRSHGVYLKTAQEVVSKYDAETIDRHLLYFQHALKMGIAKSSGYFVMSIREGWGPPLGFEEKKKSVLERCEKCGQLVSQCYCGEVKDDGDDEENYEIDAEALHRQYSLQAQ